MACSMLPPASSSAFLQSNKPAPVFSRSAAMSCVLSDIIFLFTEPYSSRVICVPFVLFSFVFFFFFFFFFFLWFFPPAPNKKQKKKKKTTHKHRAQITREE